MEASLPLSLILQYVIGSWASVTKIPYAPLLNFVVIYLLGDYNL